MSWRKKKKKLKYCTHPKSSKGWLINHEPSLLPLITTSTKNRRRLFILNTVLEIEGLPTDIWLKRQIELWRRGFVGGLILRLKTTSEEMWFFHIMPRTCYTPLFLETLMIILGTESRKLHHLKNSKSSSIYKGLCWTSCAVCKFPDRFSSDRGRKSAFTFF